MKDARAQHLKAWLSVQWILKQERMSIENNIWHRGGASAVSYAIRLESLYQAYRQGLERDAWLAEFWG